MMMTDTHSMSHTFPRSHPVSSSTAWSLLNESSTDESAPSLMTPFPASDHPSSTELTGSFDEALCVTPERTVSSRVPLQQLVLCTSEDDREPNHRKTKVHFDQTVSVHHLSPEFSANGRSSEDRCLSELNTDILSSMFNELDTSDIEPISVIASDLRHLSPNSMSLPD